MSTVGYTVSEGTIRPQGYTHVRCSAGEYSPDSPVVAEYALKTADGPWRVLRDTVASDTFELTLFLGSRLGYLRLYPADAEAKSFVYDRYGNLVRVVSEDNLSTYYEYDPLGHLVQVRDDDGNSFKVHHREYRNDNRDEILLDSGGEI